MSEAARAASVRPLRKPEEDFFVPAFPSKLTRNLSGCTGMHRRRARAPAHSTFIWFVEPVGDLVLWGGGEGGGVKEGKGEINEMMKAANQHVKTPCQL